MLWPVRFRVLPFGLRLSSLTMTRSAQQRRRFDAFRLTRRLRRRTIASPTRTSHSPGTGRCTTPGASSSHSSMMTSTPTAHGSQSFTVRCVGTTRMACSAPFSQSSHLAHPPGSQRPISSTDGDSRLDRGSMSETLVRGTSCSDDHCFRGLRRGSIPDSAEPEERTPISSGVRWRRVEYLSGATKPSLGRLSRRNGGRLPFTSPRTFGSAPRAVSVCGPAKPARLASHEHWCDLARSRRCFRFRCWSASIAGCSSSPN